MLKGTKPLAYFYGEYPPRSDFEEIPEGLFDRYVASGTFVKREYVLLAGKPGQADRAAERRIRIILYALADQEWRINAFILLLETAAKSGWSEGFERMQGSLLGYEEWQNDIFIERVYMPLHTKRGK